MAVADQWSAFDETHVEIIGYDYGEVFIPVQPRHARRHEEICKAMGTYPGVPVYAPTSGEGS